MKYTSAVKIFKDDSGATAIEYGLIAGLVSVVCIGALGLMGQQLDALFTRVKDELTKALSA